MDIPTLLPILTGGLGATIGWVTQSKMRALTTNKLLVETAEGRGDALLKLLADLDAMTLRVLKLNEENDQQKRLIGALQLEVDTIEAALVRATEERATLKVTLRKTEQRVDRLGDDFSVQQATLVEWVEKARLCEEWRLSVEGRG